ncbi:hypothetical protein SAY86_011556 [Trapa natans]|uniref:Transferring glycosyl group transferase n=1 Tax=Trapa natans TaxID=22666 RepID=A0AAN7LGM3_TRANT|nr:hypothetical protein SAY86_011556 [Trapa natans]
MVTQKLDQLPEKSVWDQMRTHFGGTPRPGGGGRAAVLPRLMVWLTLFVSVTYLAYALRLVSTSQHRCHEDHQFSTSRRLFNATSSDSADTPDWNQTVLRPHTEDSQQRTELKHIVFGIAASAKLWDKRKDYIKLWYKPKEMRGIVWLDSAVSSLPEEADSLPPVKISGDTSRFPYNNRKGHRSALRISRIVSETLRLGLSDVRWFVMGDDDTVFVTDNLVRVLRKYDHRQFYYIGSLSESHLQNIYFSYGMAYGGGGFAISYPLAKALSKIQDRCIHRYPGLYGSDDRIQACMAELGVPLTKELGFHQVRRRFCTMFMGTCSGSWRHTRSLRSSPSTTSTWCSPSSRTSHGWRPSGGSPCP